MKNENLKELQRQEAIERLKLLKLHSNVLNDFESEGKVNVSENGILFWANDEQKKMIEEFECKHNATVYHIIRSFTSLGEMYSIFYISEDTEEWEYDKEDLQSGYALVYVKNMDDDCCSEFGSITFKQQFGGLVRTA